VRNTTLFTGRCLSPINQKIAGASWIRIHWCPFVVFYCIVPYRIRLPHPARLQNLMLGPIRASTTSLTTLDRIGDMNSGRLILEKTLDMEKV